MNILVSLFLEFFKTGLLAIGGGLATLPFLYEISERTHWYTVADIANLVAVSESTPGPMGINMATYVGFTTNGIIGSIVAPLGLIVPSIIIIIIISKILEKFKNSVWVRNAFYGLRAASTALILAASLSIAKLTFFSVETYSIYWGSIILCVIVFAAYKKLKKHPIWYLLACGIIGVLFSF